MPISVLKYQRLPTKLVLHCIVFIEASVVYRVNAAFSAEVVLFCACSFGNIAGDQRVIDVRRGPIRKTAAVKTLPRID